MANRGSYLCLTTPLWACLFLTLPAPGAAQTEPCATCHRDIVNSYRQTGMGRSFYRPSPEKMVEDFVRNNTYFHAPSESYFEMLQRGGNYFQLRYQLDPQGRRVNLLEKQIDFIMGSGNHARAYLHRTPSGSLIQLPLGWYAQNGGYFAMNPGYDRPLHDGFRRPITYDCMFCHNAYPAIPPAGQKPFAESVYLDPLPEGIDCQRCHGPGASHANLAASANAPREAIRRAIVNPARLPADRQMDLCMSCHLETTSNPLPNALLRYDRGPFSFRPGEPLIDFLLNFDHAPAAGRGDKFEIVNAAYRLRQSACFLKSAGKLLCTTCHNPHEAPRGEASLKKQNSACRQCHGESFTQQIAAGRHTRAENCIDCHMPKRRSEDVVHVAVTDHLIQRRKPAGDLLAPRAEHHETAESAYRGPVVPYYPATLDKTPEDRLYLAVAQVKQGSNLEKGISQLTALLTTHRPARPEWYLELAQAHERANQWDKAVSPYQRALALDPANAFTHQRLGTALRRLNRNAEAIASLEKSSQLAPQRALTWHELGLAYNAQGKTSNAVNALKKALQLDPEMPEAHNNLANIRLAAGDLPQAETSLREAIRIQPAYPDARANLAQLLALTNRPTEAEIHFTAALRLRPADAPTRFNYALLLGRTSRPNEAHAQLEAALKADPNFADAHELLADLLLARNDPNAALPHAAAAHRLRPQSPRAALTLGLAHLAAGNLAAARVPLGQAATAQDPAIRARALEALSKIKSP